MIYFKTLETPIGKMVAADFDGQLCMLEFDGNSVTEQTNLLTRVLKSEARDGNTDLIALASEQLKEYFQKKRRHFELPLYLAGSEFQKTVWNMLLSIPYGKTTSYGWIASKLGKPMAVRAVGRANGCNRIAIVVPCHRVIGQNGDLVGYGGELWRKKWLLEHEGALPSEAGLMV